MVRWIGGKWYIPCRSKEAGSWQRFSDRALFLFIDYTQTTDAMTPFTITSNLSFRLASFCLRPSSLGFFSGDVSGRASTAALSELTAQPIGTSDVWSVSPH